MRRQLIRCALIAVCFATALGTSSVLAAPMSGPSPRSAGSTIVTGRVTYGPNARSGAAASPQVSEVCGALASASKAGSHSVSTYGYTNCNVAVYEITQTLRGQHCTLYIFGCRNWSDVWLAPYTCDDGGPIYQQWCPESGQFTWSGIPSGWLVRTVDDSCADFPSGGWGCKSSGSTQIQL